MKYKKYFKKFTEELDDKLFKGYMQYGDKSFDLPPKKLIKELKQEVLDIAGWGLILWVRLEEMEKALKQHK
jgi:hypothetical protein